jgi:hypothetical protein
MRQRTSLVEKYRHSDRRRENGAGIREDYGYIHDENAGVELVVQTNP